MRIITIASSIPNSPVFIIVSYAVYYSENFYFQLIFMYSSCKVKFNQPIQNLFFAKSLLSQRQDNEQNNQLKCKIFNEVNIWNISN